MSHGFRFAPPLSPDALGVPPRTRASGAAGLRYASLTLAALCVETALIGCPAGTQAEAPVVIGLIAYSNDKDGAPFGPAMVQAAQLAANEVNRNGGVSVRGSRRYVKLAIESRAATPEAAVAAAHHLINQENVVAIVGPHWSREALPVAEIAERAHVPLITTGSTHPKTTEGKPYVFRIPFTDALQGRVLAAFARRELKADSAAVLHDAADPYTSELARIFLQAFAASGGRVVAEETYTPDAKTDYGAQLRRIHAHRPRVLLLPNRLDDSVNQIRQARALGIDATILGSDMWRTEDVTSELEGAFFTRPERFNEPKFAALSAAFGRAYETPPGVEAVETYDAFGLIFAAIRHAGDVTADAIQQGLYAMGPYQGVTGVIDYVRDGSPTRNVVIFQVRDVRAVWREELSEEPRP